MTSIERERERERERESKGEVGESTETTQHGTCGSHKGQHLCYYIAVHHKIVLDYITSASVM